MWQAEDRVHRPGQQRGVNIYSFWIRNTIEEHIHHKLRERGLLFDEVVNGLSEQGVDELISTEEWLNILGVKCTTPERQPEHQEAKSQPVSQVLTRIGSLDPLVFEQVVKTVFRKLGLQNVRTTKRSHDGGIDLIAYRESITGTEKVVSQCKRMASVGIEVARELLGVIAADQSIAKAYLVTSGLASLECRAFCERDGRLAVIEGPLLANYIVQFGISVDQKDVGSA